jgi:hypothetical protein
LDAWPFAGQKARWLAIEPTTGPTDKLDEADQICEIPVFTPKRPVTFKFSLTFKSGL